MTRLLTTLLTGAALLGTVSVANATTIDGGTVTLSPTLTDLAGQSLGTLTLFDTTLGTLNSVTLTTNYGFTSTISVSSNSSGNGNAKTESAAKLGSDNTAINAVLNSLVNKTGTAIIGSSSLTPTAYDVTGPANIYTVTSTTPQTFDSSSADVQKIFTTTTLLTPFETVGAGTFDVLLTTLTGTDNSVTGGNASASQVTTADASVNVVYNYTAAAPTGVPEPASMALLGAGLVGAGLVRRRK